MAPSRSATPSPSERGAAQIPENAKAMCRATSVAIGIVGNSIVGDGSAVRLCRAPIAVAARAAHRPAQEFRLFMALRKSLTARRLSFGSWRLAIAIATGHCARPKTTPAPATAATLLAI